MKTQSSMPSARRRLPIASWCELWPRYSANAGSCSRCRPAVGYLGGTVLGWLMRDKMFTWEEIEGLMADLLHVDAPPAGETKLTDWAREHAGQLGVRYASELARRRNRSEAYERL